MKFIGFAALSFSSSLVRCHASQENPLGKVLELLSSLEQKVIKEGEAGAKTYTEYAEWCEDTAKNLQFAVKTASKQKTALIADIDQLKSDESAASASIEELAASIASAKSELKDAELIRAKEVKTFNKAESELLETVDMLGAATQHIQKGGNNQALMQFSKAGASNTLDVFSQLVDAAGLSSKDSTRLQALLQAQNSGGLEDSDLDLGAPAAAVYKSHGGDIIGVLEDMKEKAESELSDLRKAEVNAKHNFKMLEQSLTDEIAVDEKNLEKNKARKLEASESAAAAKGELEKTVASLKSSADDLDTTRTDCMRTAADHEATVNARTEELKVIANAKKILADTSSGAVGQTYSFAQVHVQVQSRADLARSEVVTLIRTIAKRERSTALAQLANRVAMLSQVGGGNKGDQFGKIKGLIRDMIAKLEKAAEEDATEKAYCDEQMARTEEKKNELDEEIAKMDAKKNKAVARNASLKNQVKELETELAQLARSQAEMDKLRSETHADFLTAKEELELGLSGVRKALSVLRDYYAASDASMLQQGIGSYMNQPSAPETHSKASGAGQSIIGILEVVESDFAKNLAKEEMQEDDAQTLYEKTTQENEVTRTSKEQDVKFKTEESVQLDKTIAELTSELANSNDELSAVLEYYDKIKARCIAKPETYEERKEKREAEIAGLKEALSVLEDETAFLQRKSRRGQLRGALVA